MIYLDNSATTSAFDEAIDASVSYAKKNYFNPASAYAPAIEVERALNGAREMLARELLCAPGEIMFNSGGTEANNTAIFGVVNRRRGRQRVITNAAEHPSVIEAFKRLEEMGHEVVCLGVTKEGCIDPGELQSVMTPTTTLVSIMHVNNETGAVNDIEKAYLIVKAAHNAYLHVDGVQAFLKMPQSGSFDLYSLSGHKFHAPKGVGALCVRENTPFCAYLLGGGQEGARRSGTLNTPGIMGMDAAARKYAYNRDGYADQLRRCKQALAQNLLSIPDTCVNGPAVTAGAPHILNISFLGVRGETLLHSLEARGVYVSTGSACSAHKNAEHRVLKAMGITGKRAEGAIRFSLSPANTIEEMSIAAEHVFECVQQLRRFQRR